MATIWHMKSSERKPVIEEKAVSSLHRAMEIVKALARSAEVGLRVSELCQQLGQTQATTHRVLQQLIEEGLVEQGAQSKRYRLSIEFFALAARAGDNGSLRLAGGAAPVRLRVTLGG